jgi:hypothetical protein
MVSDPIKFSIFWIAVVILLVFTILYIVRDSERRSLLKDFSRNIGATSIILALVLLTFAAFSFKSDLGIVIQLATLAMLALTVTGFVESIFLGKRVERIFGFHDYIKNGIRVYKASDDWLYSVVGNWEISRGFEDAIEGLKAKRVPRKNERGETIKDANGMELTEPMEIRFCGPISENNILGVFWRAGILLDGNHKMPSQYKVESPTSSNTIRFTANEEEVLLASTPTQEKRDLYGFLYWDKDLPEVYKGIYSSITGTNGSQKALTEVWNVISQDHNVDKRHGLRGINIDNYCSYFFAHALDKYLLLLEKEKVIHGLDDDVARKNAIEKMRWGLIFFIQQLHQKGFQIDLLQDNNTVTW